MSRRGKQAEACRSRSRPSGSRSSGTATTTSRVTGSCMVSGNVCLHLHPLKVRRHATRLRFTWCMGGITFHTFLVTVVTGVYLTFYYRPTAEYAYADMKYLEFDMPFGMLHAEHAPLGGARHGHRRLAPHVPRLPDRLVQAAARVQLGGGRAPAGLHPAALVHGLPAALGPALHLGGDGGLQHGPCHTDPGARRTRARAASPA